MRSTWDEMQCRTPAGLGGHSHTWQQADPDGGRAEEKQRARAGEAGGNSSSRVPFPLPGDDSLTIILRRRCWFVRAGFDSGASDGLPFVLIDRQQAERKSPVARASTDEPY
jgi:hypothetical protein